MLEDVAELGTVQLGVGGHGRETRMPDRVHRLEIFDAVPCDDGDAVARFQLQPRAQRGSEAPGAHGECSVVEDHAPAERGGGEARVALARTFKPQCDVHRRA
jgi:hypothetical protein